VSVALEQEKELQKLHDRIEALERDLNSEPSEEPSAVTSRGGS
jgi:BMFP domain-containing protein YqiC